VTTHTHTLACVTRTMLSGLNTSHTGAVAKYCDEWYLSLYVCVSVCLSVRISPEPHARSLPIFVHVAYGSVLLRRHCNTLCTSGFVATKWAARARSLISTIALLMFACLKVCCQSEKQFPVSTRRSFVFRFVTRSANIRERMRREMYVETWLAIKQAKLLL